MWKTMKNKLGSNLRELKMQKLGSRLVKVSLYTTGCWQHGLLSVKKPFLQQPRS